jgi:hypothetical protein
LLAFEQYEILAPKPEKKKPFGGDLQIKNYDPFGMWFYVVLW